MAAHCSGSWPLQPPQTISASRMVLSLLDRSVERAGGEAGRQHGRALGPRFDDDMARPLVGASAGSASMTSSTCKARSPLARCGRSLADGVRHVGDADDAVVAVGIGVLASATVAARSSARRARNSIVAAEAVRVGHEQAALGAVELDRQRGGGAARRSSSTMRDDRAGGEFAACRRRGSAPRPGSAALQRLAGDGARLVRRATACAGDARAPGPSRLTSSVIVVGADVEHRAAAALEVEGRVRVPALHARAHEAGGAADRRGRWRPRR